MSFNSSLTVLLLTASGCHQVAIVQIQNISVDAQFEVFRVFAGIRERLAEEGWGGAFLPQVLASLISSVRLGD